MIGAQILNYELKSVLGEGGMGTVYLAEHVKLGRKVAIKVLLPHLMRNELVRNRFINEAKLMSTLEHPNIVTLYDYHEDEHGLSLIMELAEGKTLEQYIKDVTGPIPEAEAIDLISQVLAGLAYAHNLGLIHRDIKPSNLIVTNKNRIKILDFGIAKLAGELGNKLTKTGTHIGTVYYMSPEQVRNQTLDVRSDIYSLGVTFYQMLTGSCPYEELTSEFDVFNKIVNEELPDPRSIYPAISDHMAGVIQKATAKNVNDRFQSCEEFIEALNDVNFVGSTSKQNENIPQEKNVASTNDKIEEDIQPNQVVDRKSSVKNNRTKKIILYSLSILLVTLLLFTSFYQSTISRNGEKESVGQNISKSASDQKEAEKLKEEQRKIELENERLKNEKERLEKELQEKEKLKQEREKQLENERNTNSRNNSIKTKNGITLISNQFDRSSYGITRIDKVEITDYYTIIYLTETLFSKNAWVSIDPEAYILDKSDYTRKSLLSVKNITFSPTKTYAQRDNDVIKFQLYFARINDECDEIDFIESASSSWKFYNIKLN